MERLSKAKIGFSTILSNLVNAVQRFFKSPFNGLRAQRGRMKMVRRLRLESTRQCLMVNRLVSRELGYCEMTKDGTRLLRVSRANNDDLNFRRLITASVSR